MSNELLQQFNLEANLLLEIEQMRAAGQLNELTDADLEQIAAGKGGGGRGGGSSLNRMAQMNNVMAGFLSNQARMFRNSGVRVGSRREGRYIP